MATKSEKRIDSARLAGVRVTANKCAHCGNPVVPRFRPFCSERCSGLDLAGWLTGRFRIPTEERPVDDDQNSFVKDEAED